MKKKELFDNLYRKLGVYIHDLIVIVRFVREGKKIRKNDLPNVAVGCLSGTIMGFGHSRKCIKELQVKSDFVDKIECALKNFGNPPEVKVVNGENIYIGTCAEDAAANEVLKKFAKRKPQDIQPELGELIFSMPTRPRTLEYIHMCSVCKQIFQEQNILTRKQICGRKIIS